MTPTCQYRAVRRSRGRHSAFTLTELLIVMLIMVIVAVIALPVARKMMEDAQTREASRQLQAFFSMAQTRAAHTGRPAGLYLDLDEPLGDASARQVTQMFLAEVPPPYVGMTLNARGGIYNFNNVPQFLPVNSAGQIDTTERDYLGQVLVSPGELFLVRFGYKGPYYWCQRGINPNPAHPTFTDPNVFYYTNTTQGFTALPLPPGYNPAASATVPFTVAQPFQILLPPRRVGSPLELAGGTCIDITYSGIGLHQTFPSLYPTMQGQSIVVMFKPGGEIDAVWVDGGVDGTTIPGMLHFLIGKLDKVGLPVAESNLADFNSFWVSVGRMGGGVSTSENLFNPNATPVGTETALQAHIREARSAATGREQMEGR